MRSLVVAPLVVTLLGCDRPAHSPKGPGAASATPIASSASATAGTAPRAVPPRAPAKPLVRDATAAAACGALPADLSKATPLLGDRLLVKLAPGAQVGARPWGVMGAPTANEQETRVMLGGGASAGKAPGDEAFVVLARETWQLDPDRVSADRAAGLGSLDEEAAKFLRATYADAAGPAGVDVEPVALGDPRVRAYAARPTSPAPRPGADAALVLALLVAHPDATLQSVGFYVTPGLARASAAGCVAFAERVGATLAVGSRALELGAGRRALSPVSPTEAVGLTLPADWVVVHDRGPDFDTWRAIPMRPLGRFAGQVVVSIDPYPDRSVPPEATLAEPGTLLGKAVTWRGKRDASGGFFTVTTPLASGPRLVPVGGGAAIAHDDTRYAQVVVAARDPKQLDEFRKVAETLAVGPR